MSILKEKIKNPWSVFVTIFRPGIWLSHNGRFPGVSGHECGGESNITPVPLPIKTFLQVRGSMSPGHLKITDEKVVFVHTKSGRKDTLKVGTS